MQEHASVKHLRRLKTNDENTLEIARWLSQLSNLNLNEESRNKELDRETVTELLRDPRRSMGTIAEKLRRNSKKLNERVLRLIRLIILQSQDLIDRF